MRGKNIYYFMLGTALTATGLWAVDNITVFNPGSPIKSAEVNQNFSLLKSAIEAPVGSERLADGAITLPKLSIAGSASEGKVLKLR